MRMFRLTPLMRWRPSTMTAASRHGCSVDHIIFDFDDETGGISEGTKEAKRRAEITLTNAEEFLRETRHFSNRFTPLGVVPGWSASSMASAAKRLTKMGYTYLAIGGMVP